MALRTAERKFGELPEEAHAFQSFETRDGRVRAESFDADGLNAWSLRYSEPDKTTPGRDWIVECTSIARDEQSSFSCRLSCYSNEQNFLFIPATPGPLKEVVSAMTLHDSGLVLMPEVQEIGVDISVADVLQELTSPSRWWNCIVIAQRFNPNFGIDPTAVHRNVMGCANTFYLPEKSQSEFEDAVGHDFRVFGGGGRSFRPAFDPSLSEITAHPVLKAPSSLSSYETNRAVHILCSDAFRSSIERPGVRDGAPSFARIKQLASQRRSETARRTGSDAAQIVALEELVRAADRNANEAVNLAIQHEEEKKIAQATMENEQAINFGLKQRIAALETKLASTGVATESKEPTVYAEFSEWVAESFSGRLRLHPRAEKGLKSAKYENLSDVIEGIRLLAGPYRQLKLGKVSPAEFEEGYKALGFEETKSISKTSAGKQGDEYYVVYSGQKRFLDRHLKKGTSKDARYCLRIYYFWDEAEEIVVVGSLPEHLNTTAT